MWVPNTGSRKLAGVDVSSGSSGGGDAGLLRSRIAAGQLVTHRWDPLAGSGWVRRGGTCRSTTGTGACCAARRYPGRRVEHPRPGYPGEMFFIFGLRTGVHRLGAPFLVCRHCGNAAAQVITRRVTRFTLFFIPLFPVRVSYAMQCTACAVAYRLPRAEAIRLAGH